MSRDTIEKCMKRVLFVVLVFIWGCANVPEENIIREVCFASTLSNKELKQTADYFLNIVQHSDYKGHRVYSITPEMFVTGDRYDRLLSTGKPFAYTKYFKLNNTYVFLNLLNRSKSAISKKMFDELYLDTGLFIDPFIVVLVINPQNHKYMLIQDNQRYLPIDSLLQESSAQIDKELGHINDH